MRIVLLSLAAAALFVCNAMAGDCCEKPACCDGCAPQKTTCKIVCEMKKVTKHVWVVECEPICIAVPGCCKKSCCGSDACGCEADMCGCGQCDPCAELRSRPLVKPKCCKQRCRKKLVKKEIVCEVPTYKCVVVPCGSCCGAAGCCDGEEATPIREEKSAVRSAPLPPAEVRSASRSR